MAIKRLKPKWNSTNPTSTAAPAPSAGEIGEFLINRESGCAYIKKNNSSMQDVGPVKSVNGEAGDVTISSDDIGTDGAVITSATTINGQFLKNAKVIVVDSATDVQIQIGSDNFSPLPTYSQILICQKQAGRAVFGLGQGVALISQGNLTASGGAGTMCSLIKIAPYTWMLGGALS
jgi:hypothetical protein